MTELTPQDLTWCLRRLPRSLLDMLAGRPRQLTVAGGYVRACVSGEPVQDIDVFAPNPDVARSCALLLAGNNLRTVNTENAVTVVMRPCPVQFIHRWTFATPEEVIPSFDFTVARAAFWHGGTQWHSLVDDRFYADLASKRLVYCCPDRVEDAGGSMLRILKFYQRGYRIPLDSLGAVMARMMMAVDMKAVEEVGHGVSKTIEQILSDRMTALLREVDPEVDPSHSAHLPPNQPSMAAVHGANYTVDRSADDDTSLVELATAAAILDRHHRNEEPEQ